MCIIFIQMIKIAANGMMSPDAVLLYFEDALSRGFVNALRKAYTTIFPFGKHHPLLHCLFVCCAFVVDVFFCSRNSHNHQVQANVKQISQLGQKSLVTGVVAGMDTLLLQLVGALSTLEMGILQ